METNHVLWWGCRGGRLVVRRCMVVKTPQNPTQKGLGTTRVQFETHVPRTAQSGKCHNATTKRLFQLLFTPTELFRYRGECGEEPTVLVPPSLVVRCHCGSESSLVSNGIRQMPTENGVVMGVTCNASGPKTTNGRVINQSLFATPCPGLENCVGPGIGGCACQDMHR